ncbi:MAG TPA: hypothetical protein VGS00_09255, partial [Thermoanaerobaculia bacterium]|nr:hypothetical protein [Thermoanaerobaculia bacterium]
SRLLWRFLFDRQLSLFARQVRKNRGRVTLDSEVRPDMELVETAGRPEVELLEPAEPPAGG